MTKKDWQIKNKMTDKDMEMLTDMITFFNGKITKVS